MTHTPQEVASIGRNMPADQRRAIKRAPTGWFNLPLAHADCVALRHSNLTRHYRHQTQARASLSLTPLGLAVRQHLQDNPA